MPQPHLISLANEQAAAGACEESGVSLICVEPRGSVQAALPWPSTLTPDVSVGPLCPCGALRTVKRPTYLARSRPRSMGVALWGATMTCSVTEELSNF